MSNPIEINEKDIENVDNNIVDEERKVKPKKKYDYKCQHGITKYYCSNPICGGGSGLCKKHNKYKRLCNDPECGGGSALCKHNKQKVYCRDVECGGGSAYCKHNNRKTYCKDPECRGSAICIHNKDKRYCKELECNGGSAYCIHNIIKYYCKDPECGGGSVYCKHDIQKRNCKDPECGGGSVYCPHGTIKTRCKEQGCNGSAICKHNINKIYCQNLECGGGSAYCSHNKQKIYCKEHGGSQLCKSSWCHTIAKNKQYEGYCLICFIHLFPGKTLSKNYKIKENEVKKIVFQHFPTSKFDWKVDKTVEGGCSKKRPDLYLDLGFVVLIIEIDENKHSGADYSCDYSRMEQLSEDIGFSRPIIFLRFNPDSYINKNNKKITSCWKINNNGTMTITKPKEWGQRCDKLKKQMEYWIKEENKPKNLIEIEYLYYNEIEAEENEEAKNEEESD